MVQQLKQMSLVLLSLWLTRWNQTIGV